MSEYKLVNRKLRDKVLYNMDAAERLEFSCDSLVFANRYMTSMWNDLAESILDYRAKIYESVESELYNKNF